MIYCVEDDDSIRELMVYALRASGFEAEGFSDGKSFFDALEKEMPDLITLESAEGKGTRVEVRFPKN